MIVGLVGHGYVGNAIINALQEVGLGILHYSHRDFRPSREADIFVNAAGFVGEPNADVCEDQRAECLWGNTFWPIHMEERAGNRQVIHLGSGCLYQGGPWTESDPPVGPLPFYSECRALMERALAPHMRKSYLLRIRQPFDAIEHPHNLLTKLSRYTRLVDHRNSISCLDDVARVVVHFIQNRPPPGIYNCTNPGSVSNREIADLLGLEKEWMTEEEFKSWVKAPRTVCTLHTSKLEAVVPLRPIREALRLCVQKMKSQQEGPWGKRN